MRTDDVEQLSPVLDQDLGIDSVLEPLHREALVAELPVPLGGGQLGWKSLGFADSQVRSRRAPVGRRGRKMAAATCVTCSAPGNRSVDRIKESGFHRAQGTA